MIDMEQIEKYSYIPLPEALHLTESRNPRTGRFDFDSDKTIANSISVVRSVNIRFDFDLDETNLFPSEIERPLPFEK